MVVINKTSVFINAATPPVCFPFPTFIAKYQLTPREGWQLLFVLYVNEDDNQAALHRR